MSVLTGNVTRTTPATAAPASVDSATSEQSSQASDKYRAGTEAFEAGHFDEALALFRASYETVASPNSHLMIARTLSKMGKHRDAVVEIEETVNEADLASQKSDKYKKTAQTARTERDDMRRRVGYVIVDLEAAVTINGTPLPSPSLGEILADPGKNEVVLRLPSGEEVRRVVEVTAGQKTHVALAPPAGTAVSVVAVAPAPAACPPAPPPVASGGGGIDQRTLAYVAGGIGVAGVATFAVFGLLDHSKYDDLKNRCPGGRCGSDVMSEAETGRQYQTLANVSLGVGIVGLVTSAALLFTAPSKHERPATAGGTTRVAVGPGAVSVLGTF
jgi:hypothetical protein